MNQDYFIEKMNEISSMYPKTESEIILKDFEFCLDLFRQEVSAGVSVSDMSNAYRELRRSSNNNTINMAYFILDLYSKFLIKSLKYDEVANYTVELMSIPHDIHDVEKYFDKNSFYTSNSLIYSTDGVVRADGFFEDMSKRSFSLLARHTITVDDGSAIKEMINNPEISKFLPKSPERYNHFFGSPTPLSMCYKSLNPNQSDTPYNYLKKILAISRESSMQDLDAIYDPSMAKKVGADFFMVSLNMYEPTSVQKKLIKKLIDDGADWYTGVKQHQLGHHARLKYESRVPNPKAEVAEMIASMSKIKPHYSSGFQEIFNNIDFELIRSGIRTAADSNKLYLMTGDKRFIGLCTQKTKSKLLTSDLGL